MDLGIFDGANLPAGKLVRNPYHRNQRHGWCSAERFGQWRLLYYTLAEDGSGQYLYASGLNCPNNSCDLSTGTVTSWKLNDGVPTALSGPLSNGSNALANGLAVALKHGG